MPHPSRVRTFVVLAALAWVVLVGAGLAAFHTYELTPGQPGDPEAAWPAGCGIDPEPGRATLVMLAHPRCPCTRAGLDELARIVACSRSAVSVHVLFYRPRAGDGGWKTTDLWRRAAAIPGVHLHDDPDGDEAGRFGATTSGSVRLFDADGRLLFDGGITRARGRTGSSPGGDAVIALLSGQKTATSRLPVFGCPIRDLSQSSKVKAHGR
jgi:hypothetical protein